MENSSQKLSGIGNDSWFIINIVYNNYIIILNMTVLLLHSHQLNEHGEPGKEYEARLSAWLELLTTKKVDKILLTWWIATPNIDIMHSIAAKKWLIENGGDPNLLYTEKTGSLDTVWEFVFARIEHDNDLLAWWSENPLIHLSSDYHIDRMRVIANTVWGDNHRISFQGVRGYHRSKEDEQRSINAFHTTFAWVPIGDLDKITDTLWKKHPLYKAHPSNPFKNL